MMSKALSMDLRTRVVAAVEDGQSRRAVARRFGIAPSTAIKWVEQWRRRGNVAPRPRGGDRRSSRLEAHAEEILSLIDETPDITLAEIAEHLHKTHGVRTVQSTIWRLLDRRGQTYKKNRARQRAAAT